MKDFDECLEYERSCQAGADKFYRHILGNIAITRPVYGAHEVDTKMQRSGIDAIITFLGGSPSMPIKVSEKFRKDDFGDILIECRQFFPGKKKPELGSGADTAPHIYAYFVAETNKIYLIDSWEFRREVDKALTQCEHLFEEARDEDYAEDVVDSTGRQYLSIKSIRGNCVWSADCVAVPLDCFETLRSYDYTCN